MGKSHVCLTTLFRNFENYLRAYPFGFVLCEIKMVIKHQPNNFFGGNKFNDLQLADVNIFIVIEKLSIEFVSAAVNVFAPPPAHIIYSVEHFAGYAVNLN